MQTRQKYPGMMSHMTEIAEK